MSHRVFYENFELKPDTTLLLEFDDRHLGKGRILYRLTADSFGFYHDPAETEDYDISKPWVAMGFCIDGNEHTRPQSVREVLPTEPEPITIDGLDEIGWDELEEGMTVVVELPGDSLEPLTRIERVIDEGDLENLEDGQIYPFNITLDEGSHRLYLKVASERSPLTDCR